MKEKGSVLSISKADFIKMVGKKANITQECVEAVLDGMEDTLVDLFHQEIYRLELECERLLADAFRIQGK